MLEGCSGKCIISQKLHILQSKNIKIIANYKEIIFLKSERAISYGITNMRALFTDLVTFVPLFQIKLLYRYKKFSEQYISFLFVQNFEKYL